MMLGFFQEAQLLFLLLLRVLSSHNVQALSMPDDFVLSTRRELLGRAVILGAAGCTVLSQAPKPAIAARGAFELDSEYYLRDLLGGNKKEGNILPSKPPESPPPRVLSGPLLPMLLNNDFSASCVPVQALIQQLALNSGDGESKIAKTIADSAQDYRSKASRSFYTKSPWNAENVSDQYYFDLTAYALWKAAADLLPNYVERDKFARRVGRLLYEKVRSESLLRQSVAPGSLVGTESALNEVLSLFKDSGFCKGFRVGNDQSPAGKKQQEKVFDELDDEALASGATADCLVSLYEPATLGASLQITGEQSRFAPDFVGTTLSAMWESAGIKSSWEPFFVDPEYRPNPKDYFPNEKLLQFTLTKL